MATLILTAVGTAIGGPIGGAVGAILGQRIDQAVLGPKARHGPRLGDLAVQTSTYGTAIPKLFGMMRVAGTVIWATDLNETRSSSGGGKGQPKTVSYAYSASFAVALSGRPIRAVRRIWADGKLLRGAAGDFKSATGFRLYVGDEDQAIDPLIASAEGVGQAPAFRGIAYAMFENFQLADFGNRIPSLTFEVEADPGPVAIGTIAHELSGGAVVAGETPVLTGYAASGDSVRGAVEALSDIVPLSLADRDGMLRMRAGTDAPVAVGAGEERGRRRIVRRAAGAVPGEVSIVYYDPARDYQTGLQRASVGGTDESNADRRALPAAVDAGAAKGLAEHRLAWLRAGRVGATIGLGWARCGLRPGDGVALAGEAGRWRVDRWTLGAEGLSLELRRMSAGALPPAAEAAPGSGVKEEDRPHGPTTLRLFDLPIGDSGAQPVLFAAAAGVEPGWRRAALLASFDGGGTWRELGQTAPATMMGVALTMLKPGGAALFDLSSNVEIELLNDAMWLAGASDVTLAGGVNLALIGDELVQFGAATWIAPRRFRLSRLLRGRRGTEWAAGTHEAGEAFTLIERESLAAIVAPAGSIGGEARLTASGVGDAAPVSAALAIVGESLRPPSPVHLAAERNGAGDILIRWVRRSRGGWVWQSGADTPLGEEREAYRLTLSGDGFARTIVLDAPHHVYSAALQASDGLSGPLGIVLSQIGTHAASRPALLTFE
ncbi:MAG: phage tail protein [Sphingomonas sp.]|nr:phage tail protein [Sphingomonas sp.]